jgi:hypothetical protein
MGQISGRGFSPGCCAVDCRSRFTLAFQGEAGWGRDGRVGPITSGKPRGHHAEQGIASHADEFTS